MVSGEVIHHVLHATAFKQWMAGGSGHTLGGGSCRDYKIRSRLGPNLHGDGRNPLQVCGEDEKLCRYLPGGHITRAGLQ